MLIGLGPVRGSVFMAHCGTCSIANVVQKGILPGIVGKVPFLKVEACGCSDCKDKNLCNNVDLAIIKMTPYNQQPDPENSTPGEEPEPEPQPSEPETKDPDETDSSMS